MNADLKRLVDAFAEGRLKLSERDRRLVHRVLARNGHAQDANEAFAQHMSFGQRMADRVAAIGGSWGFVGGFALFLVIWAAVNLLLPRPERFDPYPFIFLNLMLSMVAAIQTPVIMMSQNRQGAKDRADAAHDYEVNLKAEIEIMALHEKMDRMRTVEMEAMLARQAEQIALLTRLVERLDPAADGRTGV